MLDSDLAPLLQRLKISSMLQYLAPAGQPPRYTTVLSFLLRNPSTNEDYWVAPGCFKEDMGSVSVTLAPGNATLIAMGEDNLTVQVQGSDNEKHLVHLPLDYLYQLECIDAYGELLYLDVFPLLIDVPLYAPSPPKERPKLQLVVNN